MTTYSYPTSLTDPVGNTFQGNLTKITDPAGKWKIQQSDSFGNLIQVLEPNPDNASAAWLVTSYTYNPVNQLTQVQMTRAGVTQTRTFQYTGSDLTSATNPENGTVTYQYDGAHHVTQRIDAKGQKTVYNYDTYGRLSFTQHWRWLAQTLTEDPGQDVNYYYDTNPLVSGFSQNAWGRLTAVTFASGNMAYLYSYNQAGRVTAQRLRNALTGGTADLDAGYTWDNQGRMKSVTYPGTSDVYTTQYDAMGRAGSMTVNALCTSTWQACAGNLTVASAGYNDLGQLSGLTYDNLYEVRSYNSLLQLSSLTTTQSGVGTVMSMEYNYTAGSNNGRISQAVDGVVGETVNYTYDALNRLSSAGATNGSWTQTYSYDGFGNLTGANGASIGGADPATNRPTVAGGYDANGLPNGNTAVGQYNLWDVENRLVTQIAPGSTVNWTYDPYGKRVMKSTSAGGEIYFYGVGGQRLATFRVNDDGTFGGLKSSNIYFAGKLIRANGLSLATDRLGSVRANNGGERMAYSPYGQERTSTADGREKFGTYFRDGAGQDYADQRYYNQAGSFWTPDPGGLKTAIAGNPITWNRYAYTLGDPLNYYDPQGTMAVCPPGTHVVYYGGGPTDNGCESNFGSGYNSGSGSDDMQVVAGGPDDSKGDSGVGDSSEETWKCPEQYQKFIDDFGRAALDAKLPEANALALTSIESRWGKGRFAKDGNDFFNLETFWKPGTPLPANKYAFQADWMQANEMIQSGPLKGYYALVATYSSAADSFKSAAAQFSNLQATDPTTFAANAVSDGIYAGRGPVFVQRQKIFAKCLGGN